MRRRQRYCLQWVTAPIPQHPPTATPILLSAKVNISLLKFKKKKLHLLIFPISLSSHLCRSIGSRSRSNTPSCWPIHSNTRLLALYLNKKWAKVVNLNNYQELVDPSNMLDGTRIYMAQSIVNEKKRNLQPNKNFESIIESPLCSSEGSNHDYTKGKTTSEKTPQS